MTLRSLAVALSLAAWPAFAQLPASGTLSETDWQSFRAAVARIETMLTSAPDKATVTYEMARTWAAAKQWPETIQWLRNVAGLNAGLDPGRDSIFAELRGTREFEEILAAVRNATPVVSRSSSAFQVAEGDLVPESVAYDPKSKYFFFGSMKKGKVIRCSISGSCRQFAGGLGIVVGLKAHGDGLWLLSNSDQESALIHYDIASARMIRKYSVAGSGHNFNDLAFTPTGDVYLTDTPAGAVWHLAKGAADLSKLSERFEFANGITLSPDGRLLYVATFPDGIVVMDLKAHTAAPIVRPSDLCLATIDGLYFHGGALIAVQNAFMSPRVVRLILTRDFHAIERFEVLERRNPLFEGVTTGVIVGGDFFYMANIQDEKKTGFNPITILKLHLWSILRRPLHVVDDEKFSRRLSRFKFQPQLLERLKDRSALRDRRGRRCSGIRALSHARYRKLVAMRKLQTEINTPAMPVLSITSRSNMVDNMWPRSAIVPPSRADGTAGFTERIRTPQQWVPAGVHLTKSRSLGLHFSSFAASTLRPPLDTLSS